MKIPDEITKKLLLLTIYCTPLYLVKFSFFNIPTNILEILIYITFIFWIFERRYENLNKIYKNYPWLFLSAFSILIGLFISTIANQNYREGLGIIKGWFIDPMIIGIVILTTMKSMDDVKKILQSIFWSGFTVSLIGLAYFIGEQLTYDGRLSAFYLSPNHLAMFLVPSFFIGLFSIFQKNTLLSRFSLSSNFTVAALLCIAIALYLTQSYAAIISIIASVAIVELIKKDRWKKFFFMSIIFFSVATFFILTQVHTEKFQSILNSDRSSIASRIMIWKSATKMLADHPIVGIGPGHFQATYLNYQKYFPLYLEWAVPQPHNLYLAFWLESGIAGLIGFIFLLYKLIKKNINDLRQKNSAQFVLAAILAIILSTLIHGLVDTPYWKNDLAVVFWVIIALGISIDHFKD